MWVSWIWQNIFPLFTYPFKANIYVHICPIATFIYEWEMLENQCPSEVERKSEAGLPTGQRCIVGYWLVPGAAVGVLRKHIYTNSIDKASTTVYLSKVDRYFIILWEEIRFHSQYMKTPNTLKLSYTGRVHIRTEKHRCTIMGPHETCIPFDPT